MKPLSPTTMGLSLTIPISLTLMLSLASCGPEPYKPPVLAEVPIRTAVAVAKDVPVVHTYPAVFQSPRPVQLTARVAGYLMPQEIPDGSMVKTGDLVYRIDPAQYKAQLASAEASLTSAIAASQFADSEVRRNTPLVEVGAMSKQDFDNLVTKAKEAAAQVVSAAAQVELQALNVSYCTISSPMDGKLGKSLEYEGSMVGPGYNTDLNLVVQITPMWAQFSPSSTEWPYYESLLASGALPATVQYGMAGPSAQGSVVFTNNEVGQTTSSMLMRVEFPNPEGVFVQGALGEVSVQLSVMDSAVLIPVSALWARETQLFVWKVAADNTVSAVKVAVSQRTASEAVIASGVGAGDKVVTAGMQKLREGSKVVEASAGATDKPGTAASPRPDPHSSTAATASDSRSTSQGKAGN
ncbi:MAG: efflux RND transporter periplasmic adaptor subunit [Planctomycetota bacterium]|nr:efflux RND transporter periplasmic adaptor subunit [Planctomycetota bacterium]MDA1106227.1 efflux RND transporter periplasmic adaptor subunit [Planctomycetota bacterium]